MEVGMLSNTSRWTELSSCQSVMLGTTPDTAVKTAIPVPSAMTR